MRINMINKLLKLYFPFYDAQQTFSVENICC